MSDEYDQKTGVFEAVKKSLVAHDSAHGYIKRDREYYRTVSAVWADLLLEIDPTIHADDPDFDTLLSSVKTLAHRLNHAAIDLLDRKMPGIRGGETLTDRFFLTKKQQEEGALRTFEVKTYEIHVATHVVKADSLAHAVLLAITSKQFKVSSEYLEDHDDSGITSDETGDPDLRQYLIDSGLRLAEDYIDTLCSVNEITG